MKNILVVYFTQTGQLRKAIDSTLASFINDESFSVHYLPLIPKKPFPFPWSYTRFFDVFPDCVHAVPCELEPLQMQPDLEFDLVIIGYQPWFLSICIPVSSFLQSVFAREKLKGKPVVTVIACRNMWLNAQEKMKLQLKKLEANLVGNITFVDHAPNLISLITVLAFVLGGITERFLSIFPKYGVSGEDLQKMGPACSQILADRLKEGNFDGMQSELNAIGAVRIIPSLMLMEGRGKVLFPLYANYISKKGTMGSEARKTRVQIFGIVLPTAILILSPLITIASRLAPILFPRKTKKEITYFSQNELR